MNSPRRFNTEEEFERAVNRLQELKRNPSASNQNEVRELSESVEAYRRENPNTGGSGSQGETTGGSQGQSQSQGTTDDQAKKSR
jgi:hypothetical protein